MKIKLFKNLAVLCLTVSLLLQNVVLLTPAYAAKDRSQENLIPQPQPTKATSIQLIKKSMKINWLEDKAEITVLYELFNPHKYNKLLPMQISLPLDEEKKETDKENTENSDFAKPDPPLTIFVQDEEIPTNYSSRQTKYSWNITFKPEEKKEVTIHYSIKLKGNKELPLTINVNNQGPTKWNEELGQSSLTLYFKEIHPGLIVDIMPKTYELKNNSLIWHWNSVSSIDNISVKANLYQEQEMWQSLLPEQAKHSLLELDETNNYSACADLLKKYAQDVSKEEKYVLMLGQAYYFKKTGELDEAKDLWEYLYKKDVLFPRVYWELGNYYFNKPSKIESYYEHVKELQVHPLLQKWLAQQIPNENAEESPPEIRETSTLVNKTLDGLVLKSNIADKDGNIKKITFKYCWEDEPVEEYTTFVQPFFYVYKPLHFIPTFKPYQRLFYEIIVEDFSGNTTTTGQKEVFYLNKDIPSETFILKGANLVLGDFTSKEQEKVYKWFKSYLKMAKDAKFIPVEGRNPYFICLGQDHKFIKEYKGPYFIKYTPAPFSPQAMKLQVHRYFLSYWFGGGWEQLNVEDLEPLGDALLLGKGSVVLTLKYLKDENPHKFLELLSTIGQGNTWEQALSKTFFLTPKEARLKGIWHAYGNNVLAVFIIVFCAWLGKTGYLIKFLNFVRSKSTV